MKNKRMRYQSVIFDWDGTLAKTLHLWLKSYRHELESIGYEHLADEIIVDEFFYNHELVSNRYTNIDIFGSFMKNVHSYMEDHIEDLEPYIEANVALKKCIDHDMRIGLVSSSPRKLVKKGLAVTGLEEYFEHIVSGDDVMRHKPHPEPFLNVMEEAALTLIRQ